MLYMVGNNWKATSSTNSFAYLIGGVAQYNLKTGSTYSLSDIPVGNYAVMYFIATNCRVNQMMKIMGQRVFTSLAAARESAQTEPRDTSLLGLPSPEFLYVGAVIVDRVGQVQTLDDGSTFVDLRLVNISAGTNTGSAVTSTASDSFYINTTSGLTAANVQAAIDELAAEKLDLAGGTLTGTLGVNASGGITTNQTTFPLVNTTATTVNFAGAATTLNVGATSGTLTLNNPTVVGSQTTQNLYNTVATTMNFAGAATTINVGSQSASSVVNVYNKLSIKGSSSGAVTFQVPAAAGSVTYTLPSTDGTNGYALVTNGSGTLSWAVAGATINDDTSTNATYYPTLSTTNTGNFTTAKVSSSKFTFNPSSGLLTVTSLTESSSIALKENVNPITGALDSIMQLVGVTYDRKDGSKKHEAGLIAEDVATVLPNLITYDDEGKPSGINYTKLSAYLIEAVKSLKGEIDTLKGNK